MMFAHLTPFSDLVAGIDGIDGIDGIVGVGVAPATNIYSHERVLFHLIGASPVGQRKAGQLIAAEAR